MPTLSEHDSKQRLSGRGVPFPAEQLVFSPADAAAAAEQMGYPVVAKLNGDNIAHKTERGLVKLGLGSAEAVASATQTLLDAARPEDGAVSVLLAPMLSTTREFLIGVTTDPQFGPAVVLGLGGVLTEALAAATIRLAPLSLADANDMIDDFPVPALLGEFRGEPAVDRDALVGLLLALSDVATDEDVVAIDLNPVLVNDGLPVAVDALVEVL